MNTSKTDAKGQALTRNRLLTSVTLVLTNEFFILVLTTTGLKLLTFTGYACI